MNEESRPEDFEVGDVGLVPAPGFLRTDTVQGARGRDVVDMSCVTKRVVPIGFGELGVDQHCPDSVKEDPVHAFAHAVVLRRVRCGGLVLGPLVLEELLQFAGDVLAPSIRAEEHDALLGFHFGICHKCLEAIYDFGLLVGHQQRLRLSSTHVNKVLEVFVCSYGRERRPLACPAFCLDFDAGLFPP